MERTIEDIVKRIHERYKGSTLLPKNRESTRLIIVEACRMVVEMLKEGDSVFLSDLGTFELRWCRSKECNHPTTGEHIVIPDHYKPKFTMNRRVQKEITHMPYIGSEEKEEPEKEVT